MTVPGGEDRPDSARVSVLTDSETATLGSLLERMFPSDELGPGALEIGVLDYLRGALAGAYAELLPTYRQALAVIDRIATREFGHGFAHLQPDRQDAIVDRLERGHIEELRDSASVGFFEVVWQHLREGLFSDPTHGGNREMLGWRLIGFPGAQPGYSAEEQRLDAVITREPRSLADLRLRDVSGP